MPNVVSVSQTVLQYIGRGSQNCEPLVLATSAKGAQNLTNQEA